ncbi:MAG: HAMP domain-containing protein, partial [Rubricoccaceae bacterium]|nr:HAMP domain-containing protein [Rubricoccaceae bacterium]
MSRTSEPMRWWQRFYVRLAALFLVLMLVLGIILALLAVGSTHDMTIAADQELNRDLAAELAPRFEPHLEEGVDEAAIDEIIAGLTQINRRLDVYLLEPDGEIKGWFMGGGEDPVLDRVSIEPVREFLNGRPAPVLGDDPARENTQRPFSASEISIMGQEGCYLYLILQSEDYDHVFEMLETGLIRNLMLRAALLAFLITAPVGLFLFWRVSRRLKSLQQAVSDFEHGQLDRRSVVESKDEIGRLSHTFNSMADQIELQVEELRKTDRLRRELVANVSHDLRSPL